MRLRHVVAAVSILLAVFTAWAGFQAMDAQQCARDLRDGCASPEAYQRMVGAGVVAQVLAFLLARYFFLLGLMFVSLGLPFLVVLRHDKSDDDWIMGLVFVVVPFLLLLATPAIRKRARNIERLMAEGTEAVGTVLSVGDTGVTINHNPQVRLRFRIEPVDGGAAFEAEKSVVVSRVGIPRPGDRFPVFFDPADPTDWIFGVGTPDATAHPRLRGLWERTQGVSGQRLPAPTETSGDVVAALTALNEQHLRGEIDAAGYAERSAALLRTTPR